MPPVRKIKKENIIESALKIIESEGINNISARRIAKELGTSVQPIFTQFESMELLTKEIYSQIENKYKAFILEASKKEKPYKTMGMVYIKFAKNYPEFFKILFMNKSMINNKNYTDSDDLRENYLKAGQSFTNFSLEEQKDFHFKVWLLTHGIACAIATKTLEMEDKEIEKLLESTVEEMLFGYVKRKDNEE